MPPFMSIPCTFEGDILTIKALDLSAKSSQVDNAYTQCIKDSKSLYSALALGKVEKNIDSIKRTFYSVILPYNADVYKAILDLEPLPAEKSKKKISSRHS